MRNPPPVQSGSYYLKLWEQGARTLSELDPKMSKWVTSRIRARTLRTVAIAGVVIATTACTAAAFAGVVVGVAKVALPL